MGSGFRGQGSGVRGQGSRVQEIAENLRDLELCPQNPNNQILCGSVLSEMPRGFPYKNTRLIAIFK